ncbi:UPF0606 protein [Microtus ochrogaster]|uniref:UPF0606 protein n=1 Tax=Microtus ochrogaster TaxID=79684 RepID=A0A8J6GTH6_MICOH|nr:UPF0606 protein [Microtus ochrogaster]
MLKEPLSSVSTQPGPTARAVRGRSGVLSTINLGPAAASHEAWPLHVQTAESGTSSRERAPVPPANSATTWPHLAAAPENSRKPSRSPENTPSSSLLSLPLTTPSQEQMDLSEAAPGSPLKGTGAPPSLLTILHPTRERASPDPVPEAASPQEDGRGGYLPDVAIHPPSSKRPDLPPTVWTFPQQKEDRVTAIWGGNEKANGTFPLWALPTKEAPSLQAVSGFTSDFNTGEVSPLIKTALRTDLSPSGLPPSSMLASQAPQAGSPPGSSSTELETLAAVASPSGLPASASRQVPALPSSPDVYEFPTMEGRRKPAATDVLWSSLAAATASLSTESTISGLPRQTDRDLNTPTISTTSWEPPPATVTLPSHTTSDANAIYPQNFKEAVGQLVTTDGFNFQDLVFSQSGNQPLQPSEGAIVESHADLWLTSKHPRDFDTAIGDYYPPTRQHSMPQLPLRPAHPLWPTWPSSASAASLQKMLSDGTDTDSQISSDTSLSPGKTGSPQFQSVLEYHPSTDSTSVSTGAFSRTPSKVLRTSRRPKTRTGAATNAGSSLPGTQKTVETSVSPKGELTATAAAAAATTLFLRKSSPAALSAALTAKGTGSSGGLAKSGLTTALAKNVTSKAVSSPKVDILEYSHNVTVGYYATKGRLVYLPAVVMDMLGVYGVSNVTADLKQHTPSLQSVAVLASPWKPQPAVLQFVSQSDNIQSCKFAQTMEQRLQKAFQDAERKVLNSRSNLTLQIVSTSNASQAVTLVYAVGNQSSFLNGTVASSLLSQLSAELVGFYLTYPPLTIAELLQGVDNSLVGLHNQSFARVMEQRLAQLFMMSQQQSRRFKRATTLGSYTVQMVKMQRVPGPKDPAELTYYTLYNGKPLLGTAAAKILSTIDSQRMALTLHHVVLLQADPVVKNPPNNLWIIAAVLAPIAVVTVIIIIITAVLCRKNKNDFKPDTMINLPQRAKPVQGFDYAKQHLGQQGADEEVIPVTQETVVLPIPVRDTPQERETAQEGSTIKTAKSTETRKSRSPSENGSVISNESGKPSSGRRSPQNGMTQQKVTKEEARKRNVTASDEEEGAGLFDSAGKAPADPFDTSSGSVQLIAIKPSVLPVVHPAADRGQESSAALNGEVNKALKQKSDIEHYRNKLRLKAKRKGYYDFPAVETSKGLTERKQMYEKAPKEVEHVLDPDPEVCPPFAESKNSRSPSENGSVISNESGKPSSGRRSPQNGMTQQKVTKEEARKRNVTASDEEEGAGLFDSAGKAPADPFDTSSGSVQLIAIKPSVLPVVHPAADRGQESSAALNGEVNKALKQKSDIEHYRNKLRLKAKSKGYYDFPAVETSKGLTERKQMYEKAPKEVEHVLDPDPEVCPPFAESKNRQQMKNSVYRSRQSLNSPSPGETEMDLLVTRERPRRGIRNSGYDTEPEIIEETNVDRVHEPRGYGRARQVKGHSETSTLSSQPSIDEVRQQMHMLLEEAFSLASAGHAGQSRHPEAYGSTQHLPYSEVVTSAPGTMTRPRAGVQWVPTYRPEMYQYSLPRPAYRFSQLPEMVMGSPPPPVPPRTGPVAVASLWRSTSDIGSKTRMAESTGPEPTQLHDSASFAQVSRGPVSVTQLDQSALNYSGNTVPAVFAIPAANRPGFTGYFIPTPPSSYRSQAWMSYAGENELPSQWADSVPLPGYIEAYPRSRYQQSSPSRLPRQYSQPTNLHPSLEQAPVPSTAASQQSLTENEPPDTPLTNISTAALVKAIREEVAKLAKKQTDTFEFQV